MGRTKRKQGTNAAPRQHISARRPWTWPTPSSRTTADFLWKRARFQGPQVASALLWHSGGFLATTHQHQSTNPPNCAATRRLPGLCTSATKPGRPESPRPRTAAQTATGLCQSLYDGLAAVAPWERNSEPPGSKDCRLGRQPHRHHDPLGRRGTLCWTVWPDSGLGEPARGADRRPSWGSRHLPGPNPHPAAPGGCILPAAGRPSQHHTAGTACHAAPAFPAAPDALAPAPGGGRRSAATPAFELTCYRPPAPPLGLLKAIPAAAPARGPCHRFGPRRLALPSGCLAPRMRPLLR